MNKKKNLFLKSNKIKILVFAKLGSKRLKDKILLKINNKSILEILIERLNKFFSDEIILCTTNKNNKEILSIARKNKLKYFCGSEKNLFKRIIDCQKKFNFSHFVRITADNPLTDIENIYLLCKKHIQSNSEYTFNNSIPIGTRSEVFSFKKLKEIAFLAEDQNSSEYLTYFFLNKNVKRKNLNSKKKANNFSITIDYKRDYLFLKKILNHRSYLSIETGDIHNFLKINKIEKKEKKKILTKTKKYNVRLRDYPLKYIKNV